jgi:aspartate/methionine/tyrosine aminotransferase
MAVTRDLAAQPMEAAQSGNPAVPATPLRKEPLLRHADSSPLPPSESPLISPTFPPASSPVRSSAMLEQRRQVARLRQEAIQRYQPLVAGGAAPIRVMAKMVAELQQEARQLGLPDALIASEIANRTIGDVDLRGVTERDGATDYSTLAEEFGLALPGEVLHGRVCSGETYLWLRQRMQEHERALLGQGWDVRLYDIYGVGNPRLRGWLAEEMAAWGLAIPPERVYLSIGAMDGVDKTLRGLAYALETRGEAQRAVLFPAPGFNVPEWQAKTYGYRLHRVMTRAEDGFKLTAGQVQEALEEAPDLRVIYLTISNNPTAFAYSHDELRALLEVVQQAAQAGRSLYVLADVAYVGTGVPEEDRERMRAFAAAEALRQTIFVSSLSKTHSLTGERLGWVSVGSEELAPLLTPAWMNSTAALPGEWQLRFLAYLDLFRERPWLEEKLRALYALRRRWLIEQLQRLDAEHDLFARVHLDDRTTVYNWSQLRAGEDVFSLFEKTGIAGVPGSGFGYSDEYVRLSVGVVPVPGAGY